MDIVGQLHEGVARFSVQESRVAAFILENLSFTASASIDELAARAGVSPATITRFARSVGCEDIRDLRKQLAQASERRASWAPEQNLAAPPRWRENYAAIVHGLSGQLEQTAIAAVDKLKAQLLNARDIHCFAVGAQDVALATLLQHQLLLAGISISLCDNTALMRMAASRLSDDSLLLVLALGEPDSVLHGATLQARMQGAAIFALTPAQHPLGNMASEVLPLAANPHHARYSLLMLIDLLNDTLIA